MSGQRKNYRSLSFVEVADIIGNISGCSKDVEKAEVLGLSQSDYSNRKKRGAIPYAKIIEWALENNYDLNLIFTDRDETWPERGGGSAHDPRGAPEASPEDLALLDDALKILRAGGDFEELGEALKHTINSLKKALDAETKISRPRSGKVEEGQG